MQTVEINGIREKIEVILQKKIAHLRALKKINEETIFRGNDNDSDAQTFILMIERREIVFNELRLIDYNLKEEAIYSFFEENKNDFDNTLEEIKHLTQKLVDFDLKLKNEPEKIYFELKNKLKEINLGKNINIAYYNNSEFNDVHYFDKKN